MAVIEQGIALTVKDAAGNTYLLYPVTTVDNVEGAVASVQGVTPDSNGNVDLSAKFLQRGNKTITWGNIAGMGTWGDLIGVDQ